MLRFGPIGSCLYNLSISAQVLARSTGETAVARSARLQPGAGPSVYARGTRASAAWRVVRPTGTANVRAIYVAPVSLKTSVLFDSPTIPAWLQLRATADKRSTTACHAGGPRYVGAFLAEAFGAMSATAFATDLPRTTGPPPPAS